MLSLKSILNAFFSTLATTHNDDNAQATRAIERLIVSRLSRGNISLQSGRYLTKHDLEERYNKIKDHRFI